MSDPKSPESKESGDGDAGLIWRVARRGFLVGMGIAGVGFALGIPLGLPIGRRKIAATFAGGVAPQQGELDPPLWIQILPDERIRLFVPKAEMGQGAHTGLAQIAAEELEAPWDRLEVVHASTHQAENKYRGTYGSMSIATLYDPLRRAAATMREMLRVEAARHLDQLPDRLIARDGRFEVAGDPTRRVSYGALVARNQKWQVPPKPVALKDPIGFKLIGRPMPRVDGRAKVTGQARFGHDARADGMLYGAVIRPPTIGAKLRAAEPGPAASMPGVVKVVIEDGFAGVVARSRAAAAAARDALAVKWDPGRLWQQAELEAIVTVGGRKGVTIQRQGSARSRLAPGASLTAEYRTGLVTHANLETQAALAQVGQSGGKVWTSTQFETFTAAQVERALGLDGGQIEVIPTFIGGGFGRKVGDRNVSSAAAEAARLSRACGAPVHVSWSRSEEMRHGYVRPMTHHRLAARLHDGRIDAMAWHQASGDSLLSLAPAQEVVARIVGFDPGATGGAWIRYAVAHCETTVWRRHLPLATGQWRGLGVVPNTFAIETFMDEAAQAARRDPLRFRLDHLPADEDGRRMAAVLEAAAERAGWKTAPPAGRARGVACCFYHGTVVAEVAEISVDEPTGRIRLHRVVAAIDCGRVINPEQVRCQVEGCVVMGASGALREELTVKDGRIQAENFDDYPLLTLAEAPEVETIIVETPGNRPTGCGEPPIAPIAPAIGNAFFALTGARLRQMPMSPERIRQALHA